MGTDRSDLGLKLARGTLEDQGRVPLSCCKVLICLRLRGGEKREKTKHQRSRAVLPCLTGQPELIPSSTSINLSNTCRELLTTKESVSLTPADQRSEGGACLLAG